MKLLILTQKIDINDDVLGFMHGWIEEFAKRCEKVTVICLYKGDYDLPQNVKVLSLGKEQITNSQINHKFTNRFRYFINFYRYIWQQRKNYNNVFVHMNPEYVVLGGLIWKILNKRIGLWYTHKAVNLKLKIAEKLANIIFTASKESFRLESKKLNVMGHGIDIEKFRKSEDQKKENQKFKIITVGRISPVKDYITLIKTAEILKEKKIDFEINIIGGPISVKDEEYFQKIKELILENNLGKEVKLIGSIPHRKVIPYYQSSDLFVHMSQTGSLDKAILEAIASGLFVISSNDSSVAILKNISDLLTFLQGEPKELADKIINIKNLERKGKDIITNKLFNIVDTKHNLKKLIPRILEYYK